MSPVTHLFTSWLVANFSKKIERRDGWIVVLAGISPDIDGIGIIIELGTRYSDTPKYWFSEYHHSFHNIGFCMLWIILAVMFSRRKFQTMLLVIVAFHLHILADIVGSRGPDGYQWPIPYLLPFSNSVQLVWDGQWELNAYPNFLITIGELFIMFYLSIKRGYSLLFLVSTRVDQAFVNTLRQRFPIISGTVSNE